MILVMQFFAIFPLSAQIKPERKTVYIYNFSIDGDIEKKSVEEFQSSVGNTIQNSGMDSLTVIRDIKENQTFDRNCFSNECALAFGKKIQVDKMISGSIVRIKDRVYINIYLSDVKNNVIDRYTNLDGQYKNLSTLIPVILVNKLFLENAENMKLSNLRFDESKAKSALWRSALIPGWGQIYNGEILKGMIHTAFFTLFAGSYLYYENKKQTQYELLYENLSKFSNYRDDSYVSSNDSKNNFFGLFALHYIYQLFDAYRGGKKLPLQEAGSYERPGRVKFSIDLYSDNSSMDLVSKQSLIKFSFQLKF